MKNLDLNKFGVQEMNEKEMRAVDGGRNWWFVFASVVAGAIVGNVPGAMVGFITGMIADDQINQ